MTAPEHPPQLTRVVNENVNIVRQIVVTPLILSQDSAHILPRGERHLQNKQALLLVGALGQEQAYEQLDQWLLRTATKQKVYESSAAKGDYLSASLVLSAGRYAVQNRDSLLPKLYGDEARSREASFGAYQLYKDRKIATETAVGPKREIERAQSQLQLARICIFGERLFEYQKKKLADDK